MKRRTPNLQTLTALDEVPYSSLHLQRFGAINSSKLQYGGIGKNICDTDTVRLSV
jgi:hypothetical protein